MAKQLGMPLMPWQEQVALVGGELVESESGLLVPAYREVVFSTPRQSGKTTLVLAWEIQRAVGWSHLGAQRIAYTAQTGSDARKKLLQDQVPVLERHRAVLGIKRIYRGAGPFEGIVWKNGSRLSLMASTEDAGHGQTLDLGVKDELFADTDNRRDQAMRPAMVTRPAAQMLTCSTMGTEESLPWNALVEQGRAAVDSGKRSGIAFFEWSAMPDEDPADRDARWSYMPALGLSIPEQVIEDEWQAHNARGAVAEYLRAFGNIPTKSDVRLIPVEAWAKVQTTEHRIESGTRLVFGVEVTPDRAAGAVVAATVADRPVVEIPPGCERLRVDEIVAKAFELQGKHPQAEFCVNGSGPAASLVPDLQRAGVRVRVLGSKELVAASAGFYDAVTAAEPKVWVRTHPALNDAAAGAVKKNVGDAWVFVQRSAAVNVAPLVAATLAVYVARSGDSVYEERGLVTL